VKAGRFLQITLTGLLAASAVGAVPSSVYASTTVTTDLGVETASGWSVAYENFTGDGGLADHSTTDWTIVDATTKSATDGRSHLDPDSGTYYYLLPDSSLPSARVLYRTISLPARKTLTLKYKYFVDSYESFIDGPTMSHGGTDSNQQFRVDLVTTTLATSGAWFGSPLTGLIRNLAKPTSITGTASWISETADLTDLAGQTVVLAFREVDNAGRNSAGVDSVTLEVTDRWSDAVDGPSVSVRPTVTGTYAGVGVELTGTVGTWSNITNNIRPQWYRCSTAGVATDTYTRGSAPSGCAAISGATELTYTPVSADIGRYLRIRIGGIGDGGQLFSFSRTTVLISTAPVSQASAPPTVGGTVKVGKTVTAAKGTWASTPKLSYAYQWYRCTVSGIAADSAPGTCTLITGATKSTYKLLAADKTAGYIRVKVTATSTAGATVRVSAAKKIQ
jgi:hypothetical protein